MPGLAYAGQIVSINPIPGADRIVSARVVCGKGGIWNVVVPISSYVGEVLTVFMPDAIVPNVFELAFMAKDNFRVKMSRFKGAPSEALAVDMGDRQCHTVGQDVTEVWGVTRYEKPIPVGMQGEIAGDFPSYLLPVTDEPRYQIVPEMVQALQGKLAVATLKVDGSSGTVLQADKLRVCSRKVELKEAKNNAFWKVVHEFGLDKIPVGTALQFELCGPNIQGNHLGLTNYAPYVFNAYDLENRHYLNHTETVDLVNTYTYAFPVQHMWTGFFNMTADELQKLADSARYGDRQGEGIVVRPLQEMQMPMGERLSFKAINLGYKEAK
jgi:RNA ligase (TIGR02306 family)